MSFYRRLAHWFNRRFPMPAELEEEPESYRGVSAVALAESSGSYGAPLVAFELPKPAPGVVPALAMDSSGWPVAATQAASQILSFGLAQRFHEGMAFLGYPYLAELAQRPEYRKISDTIAKDATRKWIKLTGPDEPKLKELEDAIKAHGVQAKFQHLAELDGFFGRGQLFIDNGEMNLQTKLLIKKETISKGKLKGLVVVEPIWTYPGSYNAENPLQSDFYKPREWYVMGDSVHDSRLLTFVSREVPDMLKATYSFGGLSMSQMAKPYVDNWLRTRQSISDLLHSFSTMVLATDMSSTLGGATAQPLVNRVALFNRFRDNRGTMMVDKDSETLENISTPLGTLDDLQAQAQEQMASVSSIPLVVLLGITPSGLNASSDGEIRTYYGAIKAYQEQFFRPHLKTVIEVIQLDIWGEIDPKIMFEFLPLWEMDETATAAIRKSDAEADVGYVNAGIVSPDEVRERLSEDEQGLYFGVDLSAPAPEMEDDGDEGLDPDQAADAWSESDHPRDPDGKFGSGGGAGLSFIEAVRLGAKIDAETKAASQALGGVPGVGSGQMGLTPSAVKETSEYKTAKAQYERAAETQREFAQKFNRHFASELKEARRAHGPVWQKVLLANSNG